MTKKIKNIYQNIEWKKFSDLVKKRDNNLCLKCGRNEHQTILQVHHKFYKENLKVWEYALSDCITLCKGCHAREHNLIESNKGWILTDIIDLDSLDGICERVNCQNNIRFEHHIYHPNYGYKIVGSTCVEYLTEEDKYISKKSINIFKKISDFIENSKWEIKYTKKNNPYLVSEFKKNYLRIYPKQNNNYFYQIIIKDGYYLHYKDFILGINKNINQIKELCFIVLLGTITKNNKEKNILRNIYSIIK
jgi:hypothetical protein